IGRDDAGFVDRKEGCAPAATGQGAQGVQHRFVLDGAGDDLLASGCLQGIGRASHREVIGLRAAAGEDQLRRIGVDQRCDRGSDLHPARTATSDTLAASPANALARGRAEEYMWKRDEAVRPASQPPAAPQPPAPVAAAVSGPRPETSHQMEKDIVNIGKSVVIKGELNGSEDLTIEGHVEGT